MTAQPMSTRRERIAWYLYDFANSAYASVVLLAVFSAYFQKQVVGGAEGTRLWGIAILIAMLVVAVTAPILGARTPTQLAALSLYEAASASCAGGWCASASASSPST